MEPDLEFIDLSMNTFKTLIEQSLNNNQKFKSTDSEWAVTEAIAIYINAKTAPQNNDRQELMDHYSSALDSPKLYSSINGFNGKIPVVGKSLYDVLASSIPTSIEPREMYSEILKKMTSIEPVIESKSNITSILMKNGCYQELKTLFDLGVTSDKTRLTESFILGIPTSANNDFFSEKTTALTSFVQEDRIDLLQKIKGKSVMDWLIHRKLTELYDVFCITSLTKKIDRTKRDMEANGVEIKQLPTTARRRVL